MITNSVQKTETPLLLSVVVPVFKEEANINPFLERLIPVLDEINLEYEVIFSMDPSSDRTEEIIIAYLEQNSRIKLLKF